MKPSLRDYYNNLIFPQKDIVKYQTNDHNPDSYHPNKYSDQLPFEDLLKDNDSLISRYSPLMHTSTGGDLTNLKLENIKKKCANIVLR